MTITTKYVTTTGAGAKNGTDAANAWDWATMLTSAAAGDDLLAQEGTYSLSASSTFTNSGTATSPIRLRGAKTDWTPIDPARTNAGALSTTNMPVIAFANDYSITQKNFWIFHGLKFTGNVGSALLTTGSNSVVRRCVIQNASTNGSAIGVDVKGNSLLNESDVSLTGASGGGNFGVVYSSGSGARTLFNRIDAGSTSAKGIHATQVCTIVGNVIFGGSGSHIYMASGSVLCTVIGNTLVGGSSSAEGIQFEAATVLQIALYNLITDVPTYGIDGGAAGSSVLSIGNRIDRCTSGAYANATDWLAATKFGDDTTSATQANEYENAGSNDYRLKSGSPALDKGPWLLRDIGALEYSAAGGGYTYGDNSAAQVLTTATGAGTYVPPSASDVRYGVSVGTTTGTLVGIVGPTGTLYTSGCYAGATYYSEGIVDGTTYYSSGIYDGSTRYAYGTLSSGGVHHATGVIYGSGDYATEASRNSATAGAAQILTGYSVTIAGATTNGSAIAEAHTVNQVLKSAGGNYNDDNLTVGNVRPVAFGLSQTGTLANLAATDAAYLALEGSRNSKTAGAGQILTGYSVTIAGTQTNGAATTGYTYGDSDASKVPTNCAGAGTLNLGLYCLIAGITWPALTAVDGGVKFGPVTGLEYEGTGMVAADVETLVADLLDAKIPNPIQQAQIGGTGPYYVLCLASDGTTIADTIAADPTITKLAAIIEEV